MSIGQLVNNFINSTVNSAGDFYRNTQIVVPATAFASSFFEIAKVSKMSLGIIGGCSALGIFYAKKAIAEVTISKLSKFYDEPSQIKERGIKIIKNVGIASIAFGIVLYEIYALSTSPALKDEL